MTTAEIKALLDRPAMGSEYRAAIETLLARQAEVLELLLTAPRPPMGPVHKAARILQDNPILNPENET